LRREIAKERYWIPFPKGGDRVHRTRINGSRISCWVINLERDGDGNYLFPFAEDIEEILAKPGEHSERAPDGNAVE